MSDSQSDERRYATDPTHLRSVIEDRGGYPGHPPASEGQGDHGLLELGFREDEDLKEISWDQFAEEVQEKALVGIYRHDGEPVEEGKPVVLKERDADDVDLEHEA